MSEQRHEHRATIAWKLETDSFAYPEYNRDHRWEFDNGAIVSASAASAFLGNPKHVDPEEAFVAAISSCHLLTFLAIASRKRFTVASYKDHAVGFLEKNESGKLAVTRVTLNPQIKFAGESPPTPEQLRQMHELAHQECFIANSVTTEITVNA